MGKESRRASFIGRLSLSRRVLLLEVPLYNDICTKISTQKSRGVGDFEKSSASLSRKEILMMELKAIDKKLSTRRKEKLLAELKAIDRKIEQKSKRSSH